MSKKKTGEWGIFYKKIKATNIQKNLVGSKRNFEKAWHVLDKCEIQVYLASQGNYNCYYYST